MRVLAALLLLTVSANAQQVNNATVNIIGSTQNVILSQSGANHSANLQLVGDGINVSVTQSGSNPQSFSLSVSCYSICPNSPYVINQY
jgi:hypothetical protein